MINLGELFLLPKKLLTKTGILVMNPKKKPAAENCTSFNLQSQKKKHSEMLKTRGLLTV